MLSNRRCTGRLGALCALLFLAVSLSAQTPEAFLAQEEYANAAKAFAERGSREDLFAAGEAWMMLDSLDLAREQFLGAAAGAGDSLSGLAFHKIGLAYYREYDDAGAASAYRKAIAIRDAVYPAKHLDRAHSRSNLAGSLIYLGQTDSAGLLLREAIDIYATTSPTDTLNWLFSLASLMQVSIDLQDYQVGLSSATNAIDLLENSSGISADDRQSIRFMAGSAYHHFGNVTKAETNTRQALSLAEALDIPEYQVQCLNLLAAIADRDERLEDYVSYSEQAVLVAKQYQLEDADVGLPYFNLARGYAKLGQIERGLENARSAEELLKVHDPSRLAGLASVRGDLEYRRGRLPDALTAFNNGLRLLSDLPTEAASTQLHYPTPDSLDGNQLEETASILGDRAKVLADLKRSDDALRDYDLLFTVQDLLRARVSSDESRRYLSQNLRPYFDRAIDLWVQRFTDDTQDQEDLWRAFELSERAKAYTLLTSLQRDRNAMPKREAELRSRIAELERGVSAGSETTASLEAARLQLDRLLKLNQQAVEIPEFSLDRAALAQLFPDPSSGLLVFHLGKESGHLFILKKTTADRLDISWAKVDQLAQLSDRVDAFRNAITQGTYRRKSLRPEAVQVTLDSSYLFGGLALAKQLFLTDDAAYRGGLPTGNITLIPDGALNYLPFGALPLEGASLPLDYTNVSYFQQDRQLNYAYSAAFLLALAQQKPAEYDLNLLALAPDFRGVTSPGEITRAIGPLLTRVGERSLPGLSPLRYNREEVEAITELIPASQALLASEADRRHFLEAAGSSRILHLSTHGMVNAADPRLSFVAFSQQGDSLELEEMLYYNDLSALPLTTEMAVLSACETNLGAYVPGETTLSLASAFAAAGARSTLTSLWQVDDAATKDLMVGFYAGLAEGQDRGDALLNAQLMHRTSADFAHPYYWSAFTLYGEAGPLVLGADQGLAWWGYLLMAAGLLGLLLVIRSRGR